MFNSLRQRLVAVVMVSLLTAPCLLVLPAFFLAGCAAAPSAPDGPALAVDDFHIPSRVAGIELFVRNKRPRGIESFPSNRIVLFVHGVTFPSESTFDLSLEGLSWMDFIARAGYDVYLVDVRGYGGSTRPPAMSEPADRNPPVATLVEAGDDVDVAVDFIRRRRNVERIGLIGWSLTVMGRVTVPEEQPFNSTHTEIFSVVGVVRLGNCSSTKKSFRPPPPNCLNLVGPDGTVQ